MAFDYTALKATADTLIANFGRSIELRKLERTTMEVPSKPWRGPAPLDLDGSGGGAWFGASWGFRKKITIDNTLVPSDQTDFPVLVHVTDSQIQANAQASGDDIVFTSGDAVTKLSHEIENYDSSTGELWAWVKVPTVQSAANTELYIYYGNATATNQENVSGVWTNGYVAVWHLKEDTLAAAPQFLDSTGNGFSLSTNGTFEGDEDVPGKIYNAIRTGAGEVMDVAWNASLGPAQLTVSIWCKPEVQPSNEGLMGSYGVNYMLWFDGLDGSLNMVTGAAPHNDSSVIPTLNTWMYAVGTVDASQNSRVYTDGVLRNTVASETYTPTSFPFEVGRYSASDSRRFEGLLDEARLSSVARSSDWITTEYNNQNSPATFMSFGAQEVFTAADTTVPAVHVVLGKGNDDFGLSQMLEDSSLARKESEGFLVSAQSVETLAIDPMGFDFVRDGTEALKITKVVLLKPGDTKLLYYIAVER